MADARRSRAHVPHPLRPYDPLIINAAITGMVPRRAQVPHVPVTAEQIVADAVACVDAGAAILHLHAREPDESPAWRRSAYAEFIPAIREQRPEAVICVSTSGRDVAELEKRADVLALEGDAKPDMASLTLGSLNFRTSASVNAPDMIVALAERMTERGIAPELEVFDTGMAYLAAELEDRGVLHGAAVREPHPRLRQHRARDGARPRPPRRRAAARHDLGRRRHRAVPAADERDGRVHGRARPDRARGQPHAGPGAHASPPPTGRSSSGSPRWRAPPAARWPPRPRCASASGCGRSSRSAVCGPQSHRSPAP